MRNPIFVAISGPKNAGKTHLLELLIKAFVASERSFAVIKHDAHAHMQIDHPGKDSWRFRRAGAPRVAIVGPLGTVSLDYNAPFTSDDSVTHLANLFPQTEIVIAEGFKDHGLPRIKLLGERDLPAGRMVLSAVPVTDDALVDQEGIPVSVERCLDFIDGLVDQEMASLKTDKHWELTE